MSAVRAERKRDAVTLIRRWDSVPFRGQEAPYALARKLTWACFGVNVLPLDARPTALR